MRTFLRSSLVVSLVLVPAWMGCGGGDDESSTASTSTGGSAGAGGGRSGSGGANAGTAGTAGKAGGAGGGASGTAGASGKAGAGGAGAGAGGQAGASGSAGKAGASGAGAAGKAGAAGAAGAAGGGGCGVAKDCPLPETTPADCVEAACTAGVCTYLAKDSDGDGYRRNKCKVVSDMPVAIQLGNDCDDTNPKVNPKGWDGPAGDGHPNACNDGIDQDCSGTEGDNTLANGTSCACAVGDVDAKCATDGAGKPIVFPGGTPKGACKYGARTCAVQSGTGAAAYGPCVGAVGATVETCNGLDDDCDGLVDNNAFDQKTYRCDQDADGHLDAKSVPLELKSCTPPATGVPVGPGGLVCNGVWVLTGLADDCDDADGSVYPGNTEACDSKDNNCNGMIDENVTSVVWVLDEDGDGFGKIGSESAPSCAPPTNNQPWKSGIPATDCDDTRKTVNQLGTEVCDGYDNNCSGAIDEGSTCDGEVTLTPLVPGDMRVELTQTVSKTGGGVDPFFDGLPLGVYSRIGWSVFDATTVTLTQTLVEAKSTSGGDSTVGKGSDSVSFTVDKPIAEVLSGDGSDCTQTVANFSALCKINEFGSTGTIGAPTGLSYFPAGETYKVLYKCVHQPSSTPQGGVCTGPITQCNSCDFSYSGKIRVKLLPYLPAPI